MKTNNKYVSVIIAVGKSSRIEEIGKHYPKPLISLYIKPLMQYQIEMIKSVG